MAKFIIHCTIDRYGIWEDYAAIANNESELDKIADQLSSDLFNEFWKSVAEEEGYDVNEMKNSDWYELYNRVDGYVYRDWSIEEINETNETSMEEWKSLELIYSSDPKNETTQDN